jgi:uncharacterized OB-fold protein
VEGFPITYTAFLQNLAEQRLVATGCPVCDTVTFPPAAVCPKCYNERVKWVELPTTGRLAAFTSIFVGQSGMIAQGFSREHPYVTGVIELDNGLRVSARLTGVDALHPDLNWIGRPVEADFSVQDEAAKPVLAFRVI